MLNAHSILRELSFERLAACRKRKNCITLMQVLRSVQGLKLRRYW